MANVVIPSPPVENSDPWFDPRNTFDQAVKAQLEGPLSESELDGRYARTGAGLVGVTVWPTEAAIPSPVNGVIYFVRD